MSNSSPKRERRPLSKTAKWVVGLALIYCLGGVALMGHQVIEAKKANQASRVASGLRQNETMATKDCPWNGVPR